MSNTHTHGLSFIERRSGRSFYWRGGPDREARKLGVTFARKKMPIASPRYAFSSVMVSGAPADPGVYALWENDELIYYGHARGPSLTIQSCLQEHLKGDNPCTRNATHYGWEISANPPLREAELLREYQRANRRLPRCNRK
jgi:hypothetical protein